MSSISVVIPVFRSEATLRELYNHLVPALECVERFEVIMVEDGGGDGSWDVIRELANRDARVRGIKLNRNFGQHNALLCGIRLARYDVIVTMDDDLQHPISEIQKLLDKLEQGYDVVYGAPKEEQHGFWRDLASRITKIVLKGAMGVETARNVCAFRAFRTVLRDGFAEFRSPTVSIDVLLTWGTSRFAVVTVPHSPRKAGVSHYTVRKLVTHAFNMLTGFSALPLQLASVLGFVFTLFGFGVLAWVFGRYLLTGSSVPGFPFLASIIAIFSGAQLFTLGIFGEYMARIHFRTMDRPAYVVGQTCNAADTVNEPYEEIGHPAEIED